MTIVRPLALVASLLALTACSGGVDRARLLNAMVGQPETEVVRVFGVPSRTFAAGGHTFLAYTEQSATVIGGGPFFGAGFGGFGYGPGLGYGPGFGYFGGFPTEVVPRTCETTFDVANGRVVTWSLRGNACG